MNTIWDDRLVIHIIITQTVCGACTRQKAKNDRNRSIETIEVEAKSTLANSIRTNNKAKMPRYGNDEPRENEDLSNAVRRGARAAKMPAQKVYAQKRHEV